ncbi:MAG: hypothetical protein LRZ85_09090 [Alphaproteobacteria bacterium]|nr:hypothetical protein [Alphaproteobacteria bacterium]MCD8519724.1 hypothetical protein [Alphaproteobacteria bacterium]
MQNTETTGFLINFRSLWRSATSFSFSNTYKPRINKQPPRRFSFETQERPDGRQVLYFPFASVSDVHWGTRACRAKRFAHMMHHTESAELHGVGDMIDLKYMVKKEYWNIGPWHREGIAHVLRKAEEGTKVLYYRGNHETGMREIVDHKAGNPAPLWRTNREIMGIKLVYDHERTDPQGRRHYMTHGDVFDYGAFESEKLAGLMKILIAVLGSKKHAEGFIYNVCNGAYESLYSVDSLMQSIPGLEHTSLAAEAKKAFKEYINERLDIRRVISEALDDSDHDVMIYGHSHMPGFDWTPGGKMLINDGCSTEHVNMLVQDRSGTFAILTWHKDGMAVEEEPEGPGSPSHHYFVSWKELGLDHFSAPDAPLQTGRYTDMADRALRIIYRLAPPRAHTEVKERQFLHRHMLENFDLAVDMGYEPRPEEFMAYHRMLADLRYEEAWLQKMKSSLPRPDLSFTPAEHIS